MRYALAVETRDSSIAADPFRTGTETGTFIGGFLLILRDRTGTQTAQVRGRTVSVGTFFERIISMGNVNAQSAKSSYSIFRISNVAVESSPRTLLRSCACVLGTKDIERSHQKRTRPRQNPSTIPRVHWKAKIPRSTWHKKPHCGHQRQYFSHFPCPFLAMSSGRKPLCRKSPSGNALRSLHNVVHRSWTVLNHGILLHCTALSLNAHPFAALRVFAF